MTKKPEKVMKEKDEETSNEHVRSAISKRTGEHPARGLFWNCSFEALHKFAEKYDLFET